MLEVAVLEIVGSRHSLTQDAWASGESILVLADGVGSWNRHGVNPSLWSHILVWEVSTSLNEDAGDTDTVALIRQSLARCRLPGSSTLSVIRFFDGSARTYNLGDSFWMQIRDGRIISRSVDTLRPSGTPRQLGRGLDGNLHGDDIPDDGTTQDLRVMDGDTFIVASDGIRGIIDPRTLAETCSGEPAAAVEILRSLINDILTSMDGDYQHDDITVMVARYESQ